MDLLTLRCPHCGQQHQDDFECLGSGSSEFLRCENPTCLMSFAFLIHECATCGNESVFAWKEMPGPTALAELLCHHCAEPLNEAVGQKEDADPPQ